MTLEQLKTLEAIVRLGSFSKAARELNKGHSAVVYSLKTLEEQTGLSLLDRSGYRTALTAVGRRVLEKAQSLLGVAEELEDLCRSLRGDWEPYLRVVYDGLVPVEPIVQAATEVQRSSPATRVALHTEFLGGVEERFARSEADFMISVLRPDPALLKTLHAEELEPLEARLVAAHNHPLFTGATPTSPTEDAAPVSLSELQRHVFLTVHGSDQRLEMSTSVLDKESTFHLSDFIAKKTSLLKGVGYGWMPTYLIRDELDRGDLRVIEWEETNRHVFHPKLYYRRTTAAGRAHELFRARLLNPPR